ncbi:MAG: TetR/AcrR family transcriptional regulator, partial [Minisyncoccia bacterium]
EDILHKIVVAESTKTYHTKQIEKENDQGFFKTYKLLNKKLAGFISEINPQFKYPRALASTILEMANTHIYFAIHLPSMTDVSVDNGDLSQIEQLLWDFTKANLNFQTTSTEN